MRSLREKIVASLVAIALLVTAHVANAQTFQNDAGGNEYVAASGEHEPHVITGTQKRVKLPDDSRKLYVSVYVENEKQLVQFIAQHPEIAKYKHGNHYKVYRKGDPLAKTRFAKVKNYPVAFVQKADGTTVWSSSTSCWFPGQRLFQGKRALPWRENVDNCLKRKGDSSPVDEGDDEGLEESDENQDDGPEPPVEPESTLPGDLLFVGIGLAIGAGFKLYKEQKGSSRNDD